MKRVLLTGAGGFAGAHVLLHLLRETGWDIIATDSFRHKGKTDRIAAMLGAEPGYRSRVQVILHDLGAPLSPQMAGRIGHVDYVIALASESHVDRSISDPVPFTRNNVDVVLNTLEYCREIRPQTVIWFSTDEVYGPLRGDPHPEWAPVIPSNPYSASKAAQEAIAISYWRTYGVPVVIVNSMNLIGEMQDPEKFLPMVISRISAGHTVPIHGVAGDIGSRFFIHARNVADALLFILGHPAASFPCTHQPDRYNVVGDRLTNLELAEAVAGIMGRPLDYELVDFHSARPGHDPHYGLDGAKLAALGWKPPATFTESLAKTVRWALAHPQWLA